MFCKPGDTIRFLAFYQDSSGLGKTGLTVTVAINKGTTNVITAASATAASVLDATNQPGVYYYDYVVPAGYYGDLEAQFTTTDTTVIARSGQTFYLSVPWVALVSALTGAVLSVASPVQASGDVLLRIGDSYYAVDNRAVVFPYTGPTNLAGSTNIVYRVGPMIVTGSVAGAVGNQAITFELSSAMTLLLTQGTFRHSVSMALSTGHIATPIVGNTVVSIL